MSDTPRTDAVALDEREGVTHPDLCETYMAWTDYWALREHARRLERELASAAQKADAEMERVKACEHIAEGDEGWQALRNLCPSTAAVSALRDAHAELLGVLESVVAVWNTYVAEDADGIIGRAREVVTKAKKAPR